MAKRSNSEGSRPKKRSKKSFLNPSGRGFLFNLLYWLIVLSIWALVGALGIVAWYAYDLPSVEKLSSIKNKPSITLLDHKGRKIIQLGEVFGEPIQLNHLPAHLPQAVIATEDRRFYSHFGIDLFGLVRAILKNFSAGRIVQGGSTISQQLAKNVFLTHRRTLKRKVQEFLLALWLEAKFSKDQILTLYLNRVYLGDGAYGVDAAARRYFSKPATEINLAESAMLAGLLKAPSRLAPSRNLKLAQGRAAVVLNNMVRAGFIKSTVALTAKGRPAVLRRHLARPKGTGLRTARYFADWAIDRLTEFLGPTDRHLVIRTSLDLEMQIRAEASINRMFEIPAGNKNIGQAALIAMTPAGAIRAMIGGRNYNQSQYNRATQARRQPGSAFKPLIYLAGLESGLRPDTTFVDKRINIDGWSPRNYANKYRGEISLIQALVHSSNSVAVQLLERVGHDAVISMARRLGITTPIPRHPSIALGTAEVGLLELTSLYASFANQGESVIAHGILEIHDDKGILLYRRYGSGRGQVARPWHIEELNSMLSGVISDGTGQNAHIGRPAAGKTGTSQDYRDAWFMGFTKQLVAGVWLGNDNDSPMRKVTGGGEPAKLWRDFMKETHKGLPILDLNQKHKKGQKSARQRNFLNRIWESLRGVNENLYDTKNYTGKNGN